MSPARSGTPMSPARSGRTPMSPARSGRTPMSPYTPDMQRFSRFPPGAVSIFAFSSSDCPPEFAHQKTRTTHEAPDTLPPPPCVMQRPVGPLWEKGTVAGLKKLGFRQNPLQPATVPAPGAGSVGERRAGTSTCTTVQSVWAHGCPAAPGWAHGCPAAPGWAHGCPAPGWAHGCPAPGWPAP
eukprot:gene9128-biopygen9231